jgi:hypothetical protein
MRMLQLLWMKNFLYEFRLVQENFILHCDSQSETHLSNHFIFHSQSKHIEVRYQ